MPPQALEIYVFPRSQRNFRLVGDGGDLVPPQCLRPACAGDTFPPGAEPLTPKLRVPAARVRFPPCCVGERAYQARAHARREGGRAGGKEGGR